METPRIDEKIKTSDKIISDNIEFFKDKNRGLLSQNILAQLRTLTEYTSLKLYCEYKNENFDDNWDTIPLANDYVYSQGNLKFLSNMHKSIQRTKSHYITSYDGAERLMLKYYNFLIIFKNFMKIKFNMDLLENLSDFPIEKDNTFEIYYKEIATKLKSISESSNKYYDGRYYIQKTKPFIVDGSLYYEITLTPAVDNNSKFDRIVAFTNKKILDNYAVKISIISDTIRVLDEYTPINIIDKWEVSIRPCEIKNFARIFRKNVKMQSGYKEYQVFMKYMTDTGLSLIDLVDLKEIYYEEVKKQLYSSKMGDVIFNLIEEVKSIKGNNGENIVRYLMQRLNNKVIKNQYYNEENSNLSNLHLKYGCIPFDQMPYASSLTEHNPNIFDLFETIDTEGREHEFLARRIVINTENDGLLYTPIDSLNDLEKIDTLIESFNSNLYWKHTHRKLIKERNYIYVKGYESDVIDIINNLNELSGEGINLYEDSVNSWLSDGKHGMDCSEKTIILKKLFEKSKVAILYGAAGTGKTTMIKHISDFFEEKQKTYLAVTNPAVENLKRNVGNSKGTFKTIAKFLSPRNDDAEMDILIIDESSTVSNSDMKKILEKADFKLLLLVGDIYQIESIKFGNWFSIVKDILPEHSINELTQPYRTTDNKLLTLWNKVRTFDDSTKDFIVRNEYSSLLNSSIFSKKNNDEIVLCLNYDGIYGINNINKFMQSKNDNPEIKWGIGSYKIGDPILFNDSLRFSPTIYNNLKGKIENIKIDSDQITFEIELDITINEFDIVNSDLVLIRNNENKKSVVSFNVNKHKDSDEDDELMTSKSVVPFSVAYAVSIHKAQGLEYNSVKIIITSEIDEIITHNIFYTAITRARESLQIYWSPESEELILNNILTPKSNRDKHIIKNKLNQK